MDNSSRLMLAVVMVIAYMAMRGQTQNSTVAPNATNTANTTANVTTLTTVAPIVNTTVTALTGNISRAECRKTQLCAAVPDNCDPSVAGSCFFVSTQQSSGQTSFQLRGVSSGYIAVGLSTDSIQGGNDTTYVCANNNGIVLFFTALLNNGNLTITNTLPVDSVKGSVSNQTIQCTFSATVPKATATRSSDTSFFISLSNGIFANGILGSPTAVLFSSERVDLGNPNATVTNSLNNTTTTAAPSTTARPSTTAAPSSHAFVLQHTLSQALLILLGVLGMMML